MTTEELLIHELAQRAGISVRTIRYYIEEGLLPQPTYQGKYSYYNLSYLDRLELIRRLKESYLPLREISEIMNTLTDSQVRKKLKELPLSSPKFSQQELSSAPATKPGAKALNYINRLMDDQTKYKTKETPERVPVINRKDQEDFVHVNLNPQFQIQRNKEETWLHISLAPGVELNLRQPMDGDTERRVHQLFDFAKRIFHDQV